MMAYPAISRGPRGSFEWAMDQLRAGNEVRREAWPIEVDVDPPIVMHRGPVVFRNRIWHLYEAGPSTICKGFSSGVCGADNDSWEGVGMDSMAYTPDLDDIVALDWQLVSEVTPSQIDWHDAHRVRRWPNESNIAYQESIKPVPGWVVALWALAIALAAAVAFWATTARAEDQACLMLTVGSPPRLIPIASPFPSQGDCEIAAISMVDGKTVKNGICLPLHIFDCRKVAPTLVPLPRPRPHRSLAQGD